MPNRLDKSNNLKTATISVSEITAEELRSRIEANKKAWIDLENAKAKAWMNCRRFW